MNKKVAENEFDSKVPFRREREGEPRMTNLPVTDKNLIERLHQAAQYKMTAEEVRRQRVSYVYGNLPEDSTLTREQVASALDRLEGASV